MRHLKIRETEAMPLVTRPPMALEIDCRALTNRVTTSFTSVRSEADRVGAAGVCQTYALIDTPPQPLYTRAYVSLRTVSMRERRSPCVPNRLKAGRGDASWAG